MIQRENSNGIMEVRTVGDVYEGDELTYSYIDLYDVKAGRAEKLKNQYYIEDCYCGMLPIS
jgi:hypothetical protein